MDRQYTYRVLGCVYEVYNQLGPGLLESIYEKAMVIELRSQGFEVKNQVAVPVYYKGEIVCLFTYLRLMNCELGYVVNFNTDNIRDGIHAIRNPYYNVKENPLIQKSVDKNTSEIHQS